MTRLNIESSEVMGAMKLLCKLQSDWDFSIIPSTRRNVKPEFLQKYTNDGKSTYEFFPLDKKYRKLAGEAMIRWLLKSKNNMRKYLYGSVDLYGRSITDKKGKVIRIELYEQQDNNI